MDGGGVGCLISPEASVAWFVFPCCHFGVGGEIVTLGVLSFALAEERLGKKDDAGPGLAGAEKTDGAAWGFGSPGVLLRNEKAPCSAGFGGKAGVVELEENTLCATGT